MRCEQQAVWYDDLEPRLLGPVALVTDSISDWGNRPGYGVDHALTLRDGVCVQSIDLPEKHKA